MSLLPWFNRKAQKASQEADAVTRFFSDRPVMPSPEMQLKLARSSRKSARANALNMEIHMLQISLADVERRMDSIRQLVLEQTSEARSGGP